MFKVFIITIFWAVIKLKENQIQQKDIIQQEIDEIENLILLQKKKVVKLNQLRDQLITDNITILGNHQIKQNVQPKVVIEKQKIQKPVKISDNSRSFMNKIMKKNNFKIEYEIQQIYYLSTFNYFSNEVQQSSMLMILSMSNQVQLFSPKGEFMSEQLDFQNQVIQAGIPHKNDNTQISFLLSNNTVLFYKINNRAIKINITDDNQSDIQYQFSNKHAYRRGNQKSGKPIHRKTQRSIYSLQYILSIDLMKNGNFTCICNIVSKGERFIVIGDQQGLVQSYYQNGTFYKNLQVSNEPILNILRTNNINPLVVTNKGISFYNVLQNILQKPFCDDVFDDEVMSLSVDQQNSYIVYILTKKLQILVYEVKSIEMQCKFIQKLSSLQKVYDQGSNLKLLSIKYHLMIINSKSNIMQAFNTTNISFNYELEDEYFEFEMENFQDLDKYNWNLAILKQNQIISSQLVLSQKDEIYIYEIKIPSVKQDTNILESLRYPLIIIAILCVVGYRVYKWTQSKTEDEDKIPDNQDYMQKYYEMERFKQQLLKEKQDNKGENFGGSDIKEDKNEVKETKEDSNDKKDEQETKQTNESIEQKKEKQEIKEAQGDKITNRNPENTDSITNQKRKENQEILEKFQKKHKQKSQTNNSQNEITIDDFKNKKLSEKYETFDKISKKNKKGKKEKAL